jgi:hypothetical protein
MDLVTGMNRDGKSFPDKIIICCLSMQARKEKKNSLPEKKTCMFLEGFVIMNDWTLKGVWKYWCGNKMIYKVMKMVQKCSKFYCLDNIQVKSISEMGPVPLKKPIVALFFNWNGVLL